MESLNVLHIAECAGGVERYLQMLMPLLKNNGIFQSFVCSSSYDPNKYLEWNEHVKQLRNFRSFSPFCIIANILNIRDAIKQIQPDIIYCHSSFAGGLGRLAAIGLPCKVVYNPHGWAFNMK